MARKNSNRHVATERTSPGTGRAWHGGRTRIYEQAVVKGERAARGGMAPKHLSGVAATRRAT